MNVDIRLSISFKGHRKRKRLNRLLGDKSDSYLIDLWITVATDCPDGHMQGWDSLDIADACNFNGDPKTLINALIECNWLEKDLDGNYFIHDWCEHQQWACKAKIRSNTARKAAEAKWGTSKKNKKTRSERMKEAREKGNHKDSEWIYMKEFFKTCVRCNGKSNLINVDRDHIHPIYLGGCHSIRNIQPLCAKCNAEKTSESIDHRIIYCSENKIKMPDGWRKDLCENTSCDMRDACLVHAEMHPPLLSSPLLSFPYLTLQKEYSDELKTFVGNYQKYIFEKFGIPKITDSLIKNCLETMDKLIRIDGHKFENIVSALKWSYKDDFWHVQIKSLASLRKKQKNDMKKFENLLTAYQKSDPAPKTKKVYTGL